ncbi:polymorphic toxin type 28 domain-containing protein [Streptomyces sp. RM1]|uniref:polymorphic toxin type 28 domain-containing protein n=1 Tax=Streptomyces misionensis TaxID=67331 RepID=UPI00396C28CF
MAAMDWLGAESEPAVRVFEHDVYTVLLADDPALIHTALHRVPWKRRPRIEPDLLAFYAEHFPDHAIALCCFDHIAELKQARDGLDRIRRVLDREISSPPETLTDRGLEVLITKRKNAIAELDRLNGFLHSIGHRT